MSSTYISQQLTIYAGCFLFVTGVVGNGMNIFIFSSVRTYHRKPSSFYFLIASIINLTYILINLPTRILNVGYGDDLTRTSLAWCKMRNFFIGVLSLTSFTCSCLATIDQFFVTSRSVRLRHCSNIKWSHRIVFIVIIIFCLHGIPTLIYSDIIPPNNVCSYDNPIYSRYIPIYTIGLLFVIPVSIMIIFGSLTYRNIRQTIALAQQHADRQLVKMTLIQILLVIISIVPFGIYSTYILIATTVMKDALTVAITTLLSYCYYTGSFYIFLISSSRFCRTVKDQLLWWRRRVNRIHPTHR